MPSQRTATFGEQLWFSSDAVKNSADDWRGGLASPVLGGGAARLIVLSANMAMQSLYHCLVKIMSNVCEEAGQGEGSEKRQALRRVRAISSNMGC
jgi:hypothetical protein